MKGNLSPSWLFGLDCRANGKRPVASVSTEGLACEAGASIFLHIVNAGAGQGGYPPDSEMINMSCEGRFHNRASKGNHHIWWHMQAWTAIWGMHKSESEHNFWSRCCPSSSFDASESKRFNALRRLSAFNHRAEQHIMPIPGKRPRWPHPRRHRVVRWARGEKATFHCCPRSSVCRWPSQPVQQRPRCRGPQDVRI